MDQYVVMIWETLRKDVVVSADSYEEAHEKVLKAYKEDNKFQLTMDDFIEDFTDSDVMMLKSALEDGEVIEEELLYLC